MYKLLAVDLRTVFRQRVILSKGVARVELLLVCLSKRAKAQGVSRSGISNGITIAFVRKVTFVKNAIKAPCETPLALLAFLFAYHGKQKFDFVEVVFAVRSHKITSLHSAQGDAGGLAPLLRMTRSCGLTYRLVRRGRRPRRPVLRTAHLQ